MHMDEQRDKRISVSLTPTLLAQIDAHAREHRWTRSTAVAVLVEKALSQEQDQEGDQRSR
jgi:metal-responsive CopG/Arc/MetJ family transcriptional regulator